MGGVARRYRLVQQIRQEEAHVLLLDAGDIFQGTPYFNRYGGSLEMRLMTELGYDAATMGNHDFDAGTEGFVKAQQWAKFPFLCANYDFTNTAIDGHTQPHAVFKKGSIRVGVFGLGVALKGLVPDAKYGETRYLDPVEIAQEQCRLLKEKHCDLIICLSHLGYEYADDRVSDKVLAASTRDIHLILGGHTHTFLEKPEIARNLDGNPVLINQVGWAGVHLGRVDFEFERGLHSDGPLIVG
jgi:5'-nucleotidase